MHLGRKDGYADRNRVLTVSFFSVMVNIFRFYRIGVEFSSACSFGESAGILKIIWIY